MEVFFPIFRLPGVRIIESVQWNWALVGTEAPILQKHSLFRTLRKVGNQHSITTTLNFRYSYTQEVRHHLKNCTLHTLKFSGVVIGRFYHLFQESWQHKRHLFQLSVFWKMIFKSPEITGTCTKDQNVPFPKVPPTFTWVILTLQKSNHPVIEHRARNLHEILPLCSAALCRKTCELFNDLPACFPHEDGGNGWQNERSRK